MIKHVRHYAEALIIISLLAIPVYSQETNPSTPSLLPTNTWGVILNGCELGLRVPKFKYQSGEEIGAAVILRNGGDSLVGFVTAGEYSDYRVTIARADGKTVPYTDWWAKAKDTPPSPYRILDVEVEPHQQRGPTGLNVTKRYEMNLPGEYIITVSQKLSVVQVISSQPYKLKSISDFELVSNPVTITVVAPKPEQ